MWIVSWLALSLAILVVTAAGMAGAQAKGDPAKGKAAYNQFCVSCHGPAGKGDGPAAAALNPKPKDLTNKGYVAGLKDDYFFKITKEGGTAVQKSPLMPPWGASLKEDDIRNVIAYIRSLAK